MSDTGSAPSRRRRPPVARRPAPASGGGSEADLPLKAQARRLFWAMGTSTAVDVKLRAYVSGDDRGPGWQEFTDLDVLGVSFAAGGQPRFSLADCTTKRDRVVERMFWVRGVADFFQADEAFLVRATTVPTAARALSGRIGVGVLDPDDFKALAATYTPNVDLDGPLACLFDPASIGAQIANTAGLDRRLDAFVDFLRFDHWVYDPYRNLTQVVAHLAAGREALDPVHPRHRSLFFESAWQYALALARAAHHVRTSRMADVPLAARAYLAGGELALREKGDLAELLRRAGIPARAGVELPPYTDTLLELLTRLLVQPAETGDVLRYAEYLAMATLVRVEATVLGAFGAAVRPIAAKLLADICRFLVGAAGLNTEFRALARDRLIVDLTGGEVGASSAPPAPSVFPPVQPVAPSTLPFPKHISPPSTEPADPPDASG